MRFDRFQSLVFFLPFGFFLNEVPIASADYQVPLSSVVWNFQGSSNVFYTSVPIYPGVSYPGVTNWYYRSDSFALPDGTHPYLIFGPATTAYDPTNTNATKPITSNGVFSFILPSIFMPSGPYMGAPMGFTGPKIMGLSLNIDYTTFPIGTSLNFSLNAPGNTNELVCSSGGKIIPVTSGANLISTSPLARASYNILINCSNNDQYISAPLSFSNFSLTLPGPGPSPSPSLTPTVDLAVRTAQVVPGFQFSFDSPLHGTEVLDLVLKKNAAIEVQVPSFIGTIPDDRSVTLTAALDDGTAVSKTTTFLEAKTGVQLLPLAPKIEGKSHLTVTISGDGFIQKEPYRVEVKVLATNDVSLTYSPLSIVDPGWESSVSQSDLSLHAQESTDMLQGILPIKEGGVGYSLGSEIIGRRTAVASQSGDPAEVFMFDSEQAAYKAALTSRSYSIGVGVVPDNYFVSRGFPNTLGISPRALQALGLKGALVRIDHWWTTVHEVLHTFGIGHSSNATADISGFWVNKNVSLANVFDIMLPGVNDPYRSLQVNQWISATDYQTAFQRLSVNSVDPPVILIGGVIQKSGNVYLSPIRYFQDGEQTPISNSSDGKIQIVSSSGEVESAASFSAKYELLTSDGQSIESDATPFLVQLPIANNMEQVDVTVSGKKLQSINLNSRVLLDAILALPNNAFKRNAIRTRDKLADEVEQLDKVLKFCQRPTPNYAADWVKESCSKLAFKKLVDIRNDLAAELLNSDSQDPEETTKMEVLLVASISGLRILPDVDVAIGKGKTTIPILPLPACADRGLFSVKSVTQGEYGSVIIVSPDRVVYTPGTKTIYEDSFKVLVQSIDGQTAEKTVFIRPKGRSVCNFQDEVDRAERYFGKWK